MVEILSGKNVRLKVVEDNKYIWDNIQFEFAEIYQIEHTNHGGIQDCVWKVNGRIFTDLSCLQGDLIKDFTTDRNSVTLDPSKHEQVDNLRTKPGGGCC